MLLTIDERETAQMKKSLLHMGILAATVFSLALFAGTAFATEGCDAGEIVAKFSHVTGGTTHPKYGVFDLPFIFEDMDAAIRFTNGAAGKELLNAMSDVGFVGMGYWMSGMKYFSANKPLLLPSDANGLKFRVQASDVAKAMIEAMGASPQPMAFAEVYGALQTGVVDGQENTWSNIYTKKFFEVQDSSTQTSHQLLAYLFMTSTDFLNSLKPDVREKLMKIADEVTQQANEEVKAAETTNRQNILDAGGKINVLTPEQRKQWVNP
jgi:C4-dicarboxylate-binding protein DctP